MHFCHHANSNTTDLSLYRLRVLLNRAVKLRWAVAPKGNKEGTDKGTPGGQTCMCDHSARYNHEPALCFHSTGLEKLFWESVMHLWSRIQGT